MADWAAALGAVPYVAEHLKVARAANPQATLLVNDYRIGPAYYKILDSLRDNGKRLFDAVGIQSHMHYGVWPLRKVWNTCDTYSKLGLPLHFTETTIVSGPHKGWGERWEQTTPAGGGAAGGTDGELLYCAVCPSGGPGNHVVGLLRPRRVAGRAGRLAAARHVRQAGLRPAHGTDQGRMVDEERRRPLMPTVRSRCAPFTARTASRPSCPSGQTAAKEVHWKQGNKNQFELTI